MMVHEACGLSEEEADEIEMLVRRTIRGKPISEMNIMITHQLCQGVNNNARELYAMYCYGVLTGMAVAKHELFGMIAGG
jgi:hypothetical protein